MAIDGSLRARFSTGGPLTIDAIRLEALHRVIKQGEQACASAGDTAAFFDNVVVE